MRVIWSPESIHDLAEMRHHIAKESESAALNVTVSITRIVNEQLPAFPKIGHRGRIAHTFEFIVPRLPFVVPYQIRDDQIIVLRIFHTSRRWPTPSR